MRSTSSARRVGAVVLTIAVVGAVTTLAEAEASQRLVFWYVPTIHRSFMDRTPEVDRANELVGRLVGAPEPDVPPHRLPQRPRRGG